VIVGSVDTNVSAQHAAELAQDGGTRAVAMTGAIGRSAPHSELARAVLFLASADASFIAGAPLIVHGGM
jgi:NAD(P)-dependent dehydrogenase (short-subunit alcohol dehydrogenase family)